MGLCDQRFTTKILQLSGIMRRPVIDNPSEVIKNFRTEIGPRHRPVCPLYGDILIQLFFILIRLQTTAFISSPNMDITGKGDGFQQSRLSSAILPDEKSNRGIECQLIRMVEYGQREGVMAVIWIRIVIQSHLGYVIFHFRYQLCLMSYWYTQYIMSLAFQVVAAPPRTQKECGCGLWTNKRLMMKLLKPRPSAFCGPAQAVVRHNVD